MAWFLIFLAALLGIVHADSSFLLPPEAGLDDDFRDNPKYKESDKIEVRWDSDLQVMDLSLVQRYPQLSGDSKDPLYRVLLSKYNNSRSTSLLWTFSFEYFNKDLAKGEEAVFFFELWSAPDTEQTIQREATSHYFNVSLTGEEPKTPSQGTTSTAPDTTITVHANSKSPAADKPTVGRPDGEVLPSLKTGFKAQKPRLNIHSIPET